MERNPYEPGSVKWALLEEDWSDLTVGEIAEVFGADARYIRRCISGIREKTGYAVPHAVCKSKCKMGAACKPRWKCMEE